MHQSHGVKHQFLIIGRANLLADFHRFYSNLLGCFFSKASKFAYCMYCMAIFPKTSCFLYRDWLFSFRVSIFSKGARGVFHQELANILYVVGWAASRAMPSLVVTRNCISHPHTAFIVQHRPPRLPMASSSAHWYTV